MLGAELAYPKYEAYAARTLEYFERDVLQRPVRVKLTGELHFYKRHADASGAQQIIWRRVALPGNVR